MEIVNLSGRALNGRSRPFFGEGNDGHFYFLKRDNVSPDELVTEFVISRLAEECGLPVAPVRFARIPEELAQHAIQEDGVDLQAGVAFASQRVPFGEEIRFSHLRSIDDETQIRCLCFDWWVRNPDRCLDIAGGDPNVIWDPIPQSVLLIDHDRCLDPEFDPTEFKRKHVFRDMRPFIEKPFLKKWRTRFESAIYNLDKIWAEIPNEWTKDGAKKSRISFTRQNLAAQLIKPQFLTLLTM